MLSLSEDNQSGVIETFNSTSRYLDDLLNIDNNFFDSMVNRIYPSELQLNKANVSDAEASFLDLPFPGCLRLGLSWFNWWVSFAPEFQCCYFCESSCLFYLSFNFDFYVSKIMHL